MRFLGKVVCVSVALGVCICVCVSLKGVCMCLLFMCLCGWCTWREARRRERGEWDEASRPLEFRADKSERMNKAAQSMFLAVRCVRRNSCVWFCHSLCSLCICAGGFIVGYGFGNLVFVGQDEARRGMRERPKGVHAAMPRTSSDWECRVVVVWGWVGCQ